MIWTHQFNEIFVKGLQNLLEPGPTHARVYIKTAVYPGNALVNSVYVCWQWLVGPFEHVDNHDFGCGGQISYFDTLQPACM